MLVLVETFLITDAWLLLQMFINLLQSRYYIRKIAAYWTFRRAESMQIFHEVTDKNANY